MSDLYRRRYNFACRMNIFPDTVNILLIALGVLGLDGS